MHKKWTFLVLRYYDAGVVILLKMMDWCIDIRNKDIATTVLFRSQLQKSKIVNWKKVIYPLCKHFMS